MEYNDFLEVMPEHLIKKLNQEYKNKKVETLKVNDYAKEKDLCEKNLTKLYTLLSKSSAYFESYKTNAKKVNSCCDINLQHKAIVKSLSCCNDFGIYEGYLVPRYLTMDRCYFDHFNCEMDILRILLMLMLFKNTINMEKVAKMTFERLDIIKTLVTSSK